MFVIDPKMFLLCTENFCWSTLEIPVPIILLRVSMVFDTFSCFFDAGIPEKMGPPTIHPAPVSVPPYSDQTLPGV